MDSSVKSLLLYRGARHKHEAIGDYFRRIALRNGFATEESFRGYLKKNFAGAPPGESFSGGGLYQVYPKTTGLLMAGVKRKIPILDIDRRSVVLPRKNLKVCPSCYEDGGVIYFYWYLESYRVCRACSAKMVPYERGFPGRSSQSSKNVRGGCKGWGEMAVEKSLRRRSPLFFIERATIEKNELDWFSRSVSAFFSEYGIDVKFPRKIMSFINGKDYWSLSIAERYERVMAIMEHEKGLDCTKLRVIAVATLLGRWGFWFKESLNIGTKENRPVRTGDEAREWAGRIFESGDGFGLPIFPAKLHETPVLRQLPMERKEWSWLDSSDAEKIGKIFIRFLQVDRNK